jgi:hypothetical protein
MYPIKNSHLQFSLPVRAIIARILCCASVLMFTSSPLYAVGQDRMVSISQSILALDSARNTAIQELESVAMSTSEVADYRDFVVYLNTRIVNYCMELAEQGGAIALEDLPCPAGAMMVGSGEPPTSEKEEIFYKLGPGAAKTRTQEEKTSEMDGDFLTALGNFDEMLLKEEEKVASRVPSQRESGQPGASGDSGDQGKTGAGREGDAGSQGEKGTGDTGAEGGTEGQAGEASTSSGQQSSLGAGDTNVDHSAYGAPGGKLPPPEDDDIVARQLREAAEKEPDPELKKKLWEEYWKYKGVSKRGG